MRKQIWKKGLTGFLCTALLFTNVLSTGGQAIAAETDIVVADNNLGEENTDSATDGTDNGVVDDVKEGEQGEKDSVGESTEDGGEEQEDADSENDTDVEKDDIENEIDDSEIEAGENTDVVEVEEKDKVEDLESGEVIEDLMELVAAVDNIASGSYGNIIWTIDVNGKLTVNGTGEFSDSIYYERTPWYDSRELIISAEINVANMTNASAMFADCINLESIDLSNFDTSSVTTMRNLFRGCINLKSLDMSNFDTSNVTDMSDMFNGCSNLTNLNLDSFDTGNVMYMGGMFHDCSSLISLDISGFDLSNIESYGSMFSGCNSLISLDISCFETISIQYADFMFYGCSSLQSLDLSNFDFSKSKNMSFMFSGFSSLTSLNLKNLDTSKVTSMSNMFSDCHSLTSLDLSNFDTNNVTDMRYMFCNCTNLKNLDLSNFNTENVSSMIAMFKGCSSLTTLDLSSFDMRYVKTAAYEMLGDCTNLVQICTPINVVYNGFIDLPIKSGDTWYLPDGTETKALPKNLDYSIVIGKNYIPKEDSSGDDSKEKPSNINSLIAAKILSYKGTYPEGYGWFEKFNNGQVTGSQCYGFALLMADSVFGSCPAVLRKASDGELSNGWTCYIVNSSNCNSLVVEPGDIIDAASAGAQHTVLVRDASDDGTLSFVQCNLGGNCKVYWDSGYNYTRSNNTLPAIYNYSIKYNSNYVVRLWKPSKEAKYAAVGMKVPESDSGCSNPDVKGDISTRPVLASGVVEENSNYFQWVVFSSGELIVEGNTKNFSHGQDIVPLSDYKESIIPAKTPWDDYKESIMSAKIDITGLTDAYSMFNGYNNLKEVDLSGFDTSQVTDMSYMFYGCTSLENLDLSGFDTSQVTDMSYMFYGCTSLESLNLSSFNVVDVIDWRGFLPQSTSLRQIDTPRNLSVSVELPVKTGESWYLSDGSKITELPKNSGVSVLITKKLTGSTTTEGNNGSENSGGGNTGSGDTGENNTGSSHTSSVNSSWQTSGRTDISGGIGAGTAVDIETWKPTTPDEKKRYACMGQEPIQYTLAKDNAYRLIIENAMQGPLCFDSFESVLGDYTIGRTYNIYPYPDKVYSMDEEVQFTIKIPEAIYKPDRTYKMICVTQNGLPIIYDDLDKDPETITVRTNKFYAYALIYK